MIVDGTGAGEKNPLEDLDNGRVAVGALLVADSWKSVLVARERLSEHKRCMKCTYIVIAVNTDTGNQCASLLPTACCDPVVGHEPVR